MKIAVIALFFACILAACRSEKEKERATYLALVETTTREYRIDPERAYHAEKRMAEYVEGSIKRGIQFPDRTVLVWTYPRIAIAAEYSGRKEEAARLHEFAEAFAKQVYPGEPIDRSGRFKTLKEAALYMDREAEVSWLKEETKGPNQALLPTTTSVTAPAGQEPRQP
jgi:hypothetical protein